MTSAFLSAKTSKTDKKTIKAFYKGMHYNAKYMGGDHVFIIYKTATSQSSQNIVAAVMLSQVIPKAQQWFLHALVVNSAYQQQGLALRLLTDVADWVHSTSSAYDIVCFADKSLLPLYQKAHYQALHEKSLANELSSHLYTRFIGYQQKSPQLCAFKLPVLTQFKTP